MDDLFDVKPKTKKSRTLDIQVEENHKITMEKNVVPGKRKFLESNNNSCEINDFEFIEKKPNLQLSTSALSCNLHKQLKNSFFPFIFPEIKLQPSQRKPYQYYVQTPPHILSRSSFGLQTSSSSANDSQSVLVAVDINFLVKISDYFTVLMEDMTCEFIQVEFDENVVRSALFVAQELLLRGCFRKGNGQPDPYNKALWIQMTEFGHKYLSFSQFEEICQYELSPRSLTNISDILQIYYANVYPQIKVECKELLQHRRFRSDLILKCEKEWKLKLTEKEMELFNYITKSEVTEWDIDFNSLINFDFHLNVYPPIINVSSLGMADGYVEKLPSGKTLKEFIQKTYETFSKEKKKNEDSAYFAENLLTSHKQWKKVVDLFTRSIFRFPSSEDTSYVLAFADRCK